MNARTRVHGRAAAAATVAACALLGPSAPALSATSVESGWWTSAPVAVAPDVADGQLLVQGGPDTTTPVAYAGISFELSDGESPSTLVLTVAPNSASTPGAKLSLCRLGSPATPSSGASSGPPFDCATKVDAGPSADGTHYEFTVSSLAGRGALDVAVLPTTPADRVVFQKPAVDALRANPSSGVTSSAATGDTGSFADSGSTGGDGGALGAGALSATGSLAGPADAFRAGDTALDLPAPAAPAGDTAAAAAPASRPAPAAGGDAPLATQAAVTTGTAHSRQPLLFVGLAVAAAVLWALAGQGSLRPAPDTEESESR